jgi:hypothetical protein
LMSDSARRDRKASTRDPGSVLKGGDDRDGHRPGLMTAAGLGPAAVFIRDQDMVGWVLRCACGSSVTSSLPVCRPTGAPPLSGDRVCRRPLPASGFLIRNLRAESQLFGPDR